jgi:hypothetical protein
MWLICVCPLLRSSLIPLSPSHPLSPTLSTLPQDLSGDALSMLRELRGLEVQESELQAYVEASVRSPRGFPQVRHFPYFFHICRACFYSL